MFFSLFGPPDIFRIDDAGLRRELSRTYQGTELDRIISTFHTSRPEATPAQLYFAITTSPIWRDAIKIAEAKVTQRAAPVFMYQLAYKNPTLVPGTNFPHRLAACVGHQPQVRQHRFRSAAGTVWCGSSAALFATW